MSNLLRRLSGEKAKKGVIRTRQSSSDGDTPIAKRILGKNQDLTNKPTIKQNNISKTGITSVSIVEKSRQPTPASTSQGKKMTSTATETEQVTLHTLLDEIRSIKSTVTEVKNEQTSLRLFVEDRLQSFETKMSADLDKIKTSLENDVRSVNERVDTIETKMTRVEEICHKQTQENQDYPPEKSIIIINLKEERGKSDHELVNEMLQNGLEVPNDNIKVKRLTSQTNKPGLIKVEFPNKQIKIQALKKKMNLKNTPRYQNVFMRTSMEYHERIAQQNMNTLLREIPAWC